MGTRVTDSRRPNQWQRDVGNDEFILEQALDGDVVITYRSMGCAGFKKLPVENGVVTDRTHFDHEYFDTAIRPVLKHAGYEVAVPEHEPDESKSILGRIKRLITG